MPQGFKLYVTKDKFFNAVDMIKLVKMLNGDLRNICFSTRITPFPPTKFLSIASGRFSTETTTRPGHRSHFTVDLN